MGNPLHIPIREGKNNLKIRGEIAMELKRLCLTGIIIVISAMTLLQAATAAQDASISVEPAYTEVWQGDEFTVNITVDPAEYDVYAASYTLYFNNTLLNATSLDKGPFLTQDGNPSNIQDPPTGIDNTAGEIKYGEYRVGNVPGITGYGVLTT
ncbi:MAG TPA: hypothetical protein ENF23_06040, partial [Methanosarcinales archaeon]|nr:hypothetical protein [Methanosarcinales archaeon]